MIIFLYGRDGYRLKQNLDKIIVEYKKKYSGLSYFVLDLVEPEGLKNLEDVIKTTSFFNEKRLVTVKNAFGASNKTLDLVKTWDLASDRQRIVVFVESADEQQLNKKDKKLFATLAAAPNIVKAVEPLAGAKLQNWLVKELRSAGCEIEKDALKKLMDYATDQRSKEADPLASWRLRQEADKIISYKLTQPSKLITTHDVELLVLPRINLNIFRVVDAIAYRNKPLALTLIHNHAENGEDPFYIFSMTIYQFRNLLRVKGLIENATSYSDIIKKTGLNPFVVKKTYEQSKKYDLDDLQKLYGSLATTEISVKTGRLDMVDGLFQFVFSL